jgi:hypothetical protein
MTVEETVYAECRETSFTTSEKIFYMSLWHLPTGIYVDVGVEIGPLGLLRSRVREKLLEAVIEELEKLT